MQLVNQFLAISLILVSFFLWLDWILSLPDKRKKDDGVVDDDNGHDGDL